MENKKNDGIPKEQAMRSDPIQVSSNDNKTIATNKKIIV